MSNLLKKSTMNHQSRLQQYKNAIAGNYRNANGMRRYANGANAMAQPIDPIDSTITVQVDPIDSTVAGKCRIFGYNFSPTEAYNTENNMTVVVPESSHAQVKSYSNASPFRIKGILLTTSDANQLSNPFKFNYRTISGQTTIKTWQPKAYDSPNYLKTNQIKTDELAYVVDGNTDIEIDFFAQASADIVFRIVDKYESAALLSGMTPISTRM